MAVIPASLIPVCDCTDPGSLEAWYGNFGFFDHWRKVVLSNCREIVRAQSVIDSAKLSEARIDDLARTHDNYFEFLTIHLEGRKLREDMAKTSYAG